MGSGLDLAQEHTLYRDAVFNSKAWVHSFVRWGRDHITDRVQVWPQCDALSNAPLITTSTSALWSLHDNEKNWILTAGKVENLRIAARKLHGLELPANAVFSFWRHIGRPSRSRGFVVGREIREGCLVPTVAGGLCQLSNALYDAAYNAGLEILERHRHTQVIRGSLAEQGKDATVKWNYVDLRFRASCDLRIEVEVGQEQLLVRFRGVRLRENGPTTKEGRMPSRLNDCYSCGNSACFKHPGTVPHTGRMGTTAFLVDERWPEHEQYVRSTAKAGDVLVTPFPLKGPLKRERYAWHLLEEVDRKSVPWAALRRALEVRTKGRTNGSIPQLLMKGDERILHAMRSIIPVHCTHVVIAQNLLPFAWQQGVLGGRTFDVLMTRAPMERLQNDLDRLAVLHPESRTAADYRAPADLVDRESAALTRSGHVITAHHGIASVFNNKSILLDWDQAKRGPVPAPGNKVLFPASALARKGAYEMREVARALDLELVVLGRDIEAEGFWTGVRATRVLDDPLAEVGLVVLPAHVEHRPRLLLRALSLGIPVITTPASGIGEREGLTLVPVGDIARLEESVRSALKTGNGRG